MLELATADGGLPPEPLPPGYREILALFEQNGDRLRARDVCLTLGTGTGTGTGTEPAAHRRHARQAETPGQSWHPRRSRARPVHPHPADTDHPRDQLKLKIDEYPRTLTEICSRT